MAVSVIPPGEIYKVRGFRGAWHLVARGFYQAVWNWLSPNGSRAAPDDNAVAEWLFALDVRGLQCFGDTLKIILLKCSLNCGSKRYPLCCGSG
ncbi:hypothetical protein DEO72_LG11g1269 [Vigna unguiculata]|uniref:Uncharacterized protein n=1 Tax=Vigna unguiculata TaxID=3917 RepID=A0A4D6NKH8_VIGUN|nr:hypothetical protein DEO72_LG11g1269 [Vigna unguiculata]